MSSQQKCGLCEKESKYKCPTCRLPFCSVACGNEHRNSPQNCSEQEAKIPTVSNSRIIRATDNTVPPENLAQLDNPQIKEMLKNKKLCAILSQIDSSPNPGPLLHEGLNDPDFQQFVDVMFKSIGEEQNLA